jgi:hypothetical protein
VEAILPGFRAAGGLGQLRMFAELAPAALQDLLTVVNDAQPDLLLREPFEFAAWLAAERCRLPMVVHGLGVTPRTAVVAAVAAEPLAAARAAAVCRPTQTCRRYLDVGW